MRDRIPNPLFVSVSHRYIWWMAEFQNGDGGDRPIPKITADNHIGTIAFRCTGDVVNKEELDDQLPFISVERHVRAWQGLRQCSIQPFFALGAEGSARLWRLSDISLSPPAS